MFHYNLGVHSQLRNSYAEFSFLLHNKAIYKFDFVRFRKPKHFGDLG